MKDTYTKESIIKSGESAINALYKGTTDQTLNYLRLAKFSEKTITRTTLVRPKSLPPTSATAKFHCLRVYQQVQVWKGNEKKRTTTWMGMDSIQQQDDTHYGRHNPSTRTPPTDHLLLMYNLMWCNDVCLQENRLGMYTSLWTMSWCSMYKLFSGCHWQWLW